MEVRAAATFAVVYLLAVVGGLYLAAFFLAITLWWTHGRRKKGEHETTTGDDDLAGFVTRTPRVPGACFFSTDLPMNGAVPPVVRRYAEHTGCLRELLVFVAVRVLPVRSVPPEEQLLVEEVPAGAGVYRSLVRYGYLDKPDMEGDKFLETVLAKLRHVADDDEAAMVDRARSSGVTFVIGGGS